MLWLPWQHGGGQRALPRGGGKAAAAAALDGEDGVGITGGGSRVKRRRNKRGSRADAESLIKSMLTYKR
jgi:hypothetical protein